MIDAVIYYSEQLPGERAQLIRDVVVNDEIVPELSGPVGSPAPQDAVQRACRRLALDKVQA